MPEAKKTPRSKTTQKSSEIPKTNASISELQQPIWAVIDKDGWNVSGKTYAEARSVVSKRPGIIVTDRCAARAADGLVGT